jgi:glutamate synthase domain-containing protein 1
MANLIPAYTYENSYRLPEGVFPVSKVKAETDKVLKAKFETAVFDPKESVRTLKEASDEISKVIKLIIPKTYKFSVQVTLSQKMGQAFYSGTMCLWDPEHDNYMSTTYENSSVLVLVVVFGCLLE